VHGVIFTSRRDYVGAAHGPSAAASVFEGEPVYLRGEACPDEGLHRLLERIGEATGADADATLRGFGVFTVQRSFARLYPAFFSIAPSTREFLLRRVRRARGADLHAPRRRGLHVPRPPVTLVAGHT
jgi:hypothetical protein